MVHTNFDTVGITIDADECVYIEEMQLGRNEPFFLKAWALDR